MVEAWDELQKDKVSQQEEVKAFIPVQQEIVDEEQADSRTQEFLRWHQRLGHLAPSTMQNMARFGLLPARLARCEVSICPSCLAGEAIVVSGEASP